MRLTSGGPLRDNDELLLVNEGVMTCQDVGVVELLQQVNLFDATIALFGHHGINVNTAAEQTDILLLTPGMHDQ